MTIKGNEIGIQNVKEDIYRRCQLIIHDFLVSHYHLVQNISISSSSGHKIKPIKTCFDLGFVSIQLKEMGRACSTYGERRRPYRVLVGKPEERRPLERPRRKWEDNIKMDFQGEKFG